MQAFFTDLLQNFTGEHFLRGVCGKYHYQDTDYQSLLETAEHMLPLMEEQACWNHRLFELPGEQERSSEKYTEAAITLGEGLDRLQEEYAGKGLLSECYMVETLASELLLQAYGAYNRQVAEKTDYHVARYHFPGSEEAYPLSMLPKLLERLEMPVSCNEALCMTPKKSVVFVAKLTTDETVRCPGICVGCKGPAGRNCPNRMEESQQLSRLIADMTDLPLSYGYSRIFGRRQGG